MATEYVIYIDESDKAETFLYCHFGVLVRSVHFALDITKLTKETAGLSAFEKAPSET